MIGELRQAESDDGQRGGRLEQGRQVVEAGRFAMVWIETTLRKGNSE